MTYEHYESMPGVRVHELMQIQRAPALYKYHQTHPTEQTPSMLIGTLAHLAILEPDAFHRDVRRLPDDLDRRTKAGKEAYEQIAAGSVHVLAAADYDRVCAMRESVMSHPAARQLIDGTAHEVSRQWERLGRTCKGRADMHGLGRVADLKTAMCASPEAFVRAVVKYDYDMQAAWYLDGFGAGDFLHIAVETKPPHLVAVYRLDDAAIQRGRQRCDDALKMLAICEQTGNWPGYGGDVETLSLPAWAFEAEEVDE